MSRKRFASLVAVLFLFSLAFASGAAGTKSDPVVTLNYLNQSFLPSVVNPAQSEINAALSKVLNKSTSGAGELRKSYLDYISKKTFIRMGAENVAAALPKGTGHSLARNFREISLKKGDVLVGLLGTQFVLKSGAGMISGQMGDSVINLTQGGEALAYQNLSPNHKYMLTDVEGTGLMVTSNSAVVSVNGYFAVKPYQEKYTDLADALKNLGLFRGGSAGYDLKRPPTRLEALIMLIRLIGEEKDALSYGTKHPFTDVPKWANDEADKYVAYAYDKGYTKGASATKFDPNAFVLPEQYMTFVLRTLGYIDRDNGTGDFTWRTALAKSEQIGLLRGSEIKEMKSAFMRDQVVYVSYYALKCKLKDSTDTIIDRLIAKGAISQSTADMVMSSVTRVRIAK